MASSCPRLTSNAGRVDNQFPKRRFSCPPVGGRSRPGNQFAPVFTRHRCWYRVGPRGNGTECQVDESCSPRRLARYAFTASHQHTGPCQATASCASQFRIGDRTEYRLASDRDSPERACGRYRHHPACGGPSAARARCRPNCRSRQITNSPAPATMPAPT